MARFVTLCAPLLALVGLGAGEDVPIRLTGRLLSVNGQTTVPAGLFGVHASAVSVPTVREFGVGAFRQIHYGAGSTCHFVTRLTVADLQTGLAVAVARAADGTAAAVHAGSIPDRATIPELLIEGSLLEVVLQDPAKPVLRIAPAQGDPVLITLTGQTPVFLDGKDLGLKPDFAAMPLLIDCQGDRYLTPSVLSDANYAQTYAGHGRRYGELWKRVAAPGGQRGCVEFWNEPYLNWAERSAGDSRNPYHPAFYEVEKAVEGGPVTIKGRDRPLAWSVWRSLWAAYQEKDREGKPRWVIAYGLPVPPGLKEGDTFRGRETRYWRPKEEREFTVIKEWHPVDPTMVSFWSGRQNLDYYMGMFEPFAQALRAANPAVTILAGWDLPYNANDCGWLVWTELCRPLVDRCPELIDGFTEHHYGTDPATIHASYEVGTTDGMVRAKRWFRHFNTECGGRLDPALHGLEALSEAGRNDYAARLQEASYHCCDLIGLCARLPDKAGGRTAHQVAMGGDDGPGGPGMALRLLRNLRGDLVEVASGHPQVWAVASLHQDRVVLAAYNYDRNEHSLTIDPRMLPGTRIVTAIIQRIAPDLEKAKASGKPILQIATVDCDPAATPWSCLLPGREAVVVEIALDRAPSVRPVLERRQFFAREGILQQVQPPWPTILAVELPAELAARTERTFLRLIIDRCDDRPKTVAFNGQVLPFAVTGTITDLELPCARLRPGLNSLAFRGEAAYRVVAASIYLDAPAGP